jgi:hypothetical protein
LFAALLFAATIAFDDHSSLILTCIDSAGIESNRKGVAAVARHVYQGSGQQLKKGRLLLNDVEAMRLLALILDSNSAVGLSIARHLHVPQLPRVLLGPGVGRKKSCTDKQSYAQNKRAKVGFRLHLKLLSAREKWKETTSAVFGLRTQLDCAHNNAGPSNCQRRLAFSKEGVLE